MAKAAKNEIALPVDNNVPLAPMALDALGTILSKSGFFSDAREAAQSIVKILAGRELGIGPVSAMTGIHVIKGKVTLSANLIAGCIKRSPKYDYKVVSMDAKKCVLEFFEDGKAAGRSEFGEEDAKRAGLMSEERYKKWPQNMFFARAMSNGAKWFAPDVFGGPVYCPEELGAVVDAEGDVLSVEPVQATVSLAEARAAEEAAKAAKAQEEAATVTVEVTPAAAVTVTAEVVPPATGATVAATETPAAAPAAAPAAKNDRIERFKAGLVALDYAIDTTVKKIIDQAVLLRGARFSVISEGSQDAILAWMDDLIECDQLVGKLGLSDEQVKKMLANAKVTSVRHLMPPHAATLVARLRQAIEARGKN